MKHQSLVFLVAVVGFYLCSCGSSEPYPKLSNVRTGVQSQVYVLPGLTYRQKDDPAVYLRVHRWLRDEKSTEIKQEASFRLLKISFLNKEKHESNPPPGSELAEAKIADAKSSDSGLGALLKLDFDGLKVEQEVSFLKSSMPSFSFSGELDHLYLAVRKAEIASSKEKDEGIYVCVHLTVKNQNLNFWDRCSRVFMFEKSEGKYRPTKAAALSSKGGKTSDDSSGGRMLFSDFESDDQLSKVNWYNLTELNIQ